MAPRRAVSGFQAKYLQLDRLPTPEEDWSPILKVLRAGEFFVTTGEILITNAVTGSGKQRTVGADMGWTFPLDFVEVAWGDGQKVDRQIIRATDLAPFGSKRFSIPFDGAARSGYALRCGIGRAMAPSSSRCG